MSRGWGTAPLSALTALMALTACGGDLSNAVFVEDAAFRAALPQLDLSLAWPGGEVIVEEPITGAELLALPPTQDGLQELSAALDLLQLTVSPALSLSPSERGEDYRVWGPYPFDEAPGSFLRLEMSRTRDRALYSVALQAAATSLGPWTEFSVGLWSEEPLDDDLIGELGWDWGAFGAATGVSAEGHFTLAWSEGGEHLRLTLAEIGGLESATLNLALAEGGYSVGAPWISASLLTSLLSLVALTRAVEQDRPAPISSALALLGLAATVALMVFRPEPA